MLSSIADRRTAESGIVRCPVFKIDLKGRFVFVDDLTEKLLGRPQDMLFGRSLGNFLSEKSWLTLSAIFQRYSHYETSFEALELEFVNPENDRQTLMAVISLNFIAGNPANYQVALIPASADRRIEPISDLSRQERLFALLFELVSGEDSGQVWKKLVEIMLHLEELCQIGIYQYRDRSLHLLAGSSAAKSGISSELSPTSDDHLAVVFNSHPFINTEYLMAETIDDLAPKIFTEICYPLMHGDKRWGMARYIVSKDSLNLEETLLRASRYMGNALYWFTEDSRK